MLNCVLASEGCEEIVRGTEHIPVKPSGHIEIIDKDSGTETNASAAERRFIATRMDVYKKELAKYNSRSALARKILTDSVAEQYKHFFQDDAPSTGWQALKDNCTVHEEDDIENLEERYSNYPRLSAKESVEVYVAGMQELISDLKALKVIKTDTQVIRKINDGLPKSTYEAFLYDWEKRRKKKKTDGTAKYNVSDYLYDLRRVSTEMKVGDNWTKSYQDLKHITTRSYAAKTEIDHSKIKCWKCHQLGHTRRNCPRKDDKAQANEASTIEEGQVNENEIWLCTAITSDEDDEGWNWWHNAAENHSTKSSWSNATSLTAFNSSMIKTNGEFEAMIDSGCTDPMVPLEFGLAAMNDIKSIKTRHVHTAAGETIPCEFIGTLTLEAENDKAERCTVHLQNVLLVPKLTFILLSVSAMNDRGFEATFSGKGDDGRVTLSNSKINVKLIGHRKEGLYYITIRAHKHGNLCTRVMQADAKVPDNNLLWHLRMAHAATEVLTSMFANGHATGMDGYQIMKGAPKPWCEPCLEGKGHALPRMSNSTRATEKAERLHVDLCGPFRVKSTHHNRYYMLITDDYTRMRWIHFLQTKGEAGNELVKLGQKLRRQYDILIKTFKFDGGGEFRSDPFRSYCEDNGIRCITTAPRKSNQNAVAERGNRLISEGERALRFAAGLPAKYWQYAAAYRCYLLNRTSTTANPTGKTPFELWEGKVPDLRRIRIFGSNAMAHVDAAETGQHKLAPRTVRCRLLGLDDESYGYILLRCSDKKVIQRSDVIFNEQPIFNRVLTQGENNYGADQFEELIQNASSDEEEETLYEDDEDPQNKPSPSEMEITPDSSDDEDVAPRRSARATKGIPPQRYDDHDERDATQANVAYANTIFAKDPRSLREALGRDDGKSFKEAADNEIRSLIKNDTWDIVDCPEGIKPIGSMWKLTIKQKADGKVERYKGRVLARGDKQKYLIDYKETFSPVVKFVSLRLMFAISAILKLKTAQLDVDTAFLYGKLEDGISIYMHLPEGYYHTERAQGKVCKLKKSIYGLKQAGKCWNDVLNDHLVGMGFTRAILDPACYNKRLGTNFTVALIYVDDILLFSTEQSELQLFNEQMKTRFSMKPMGPIKFALGIHVEETQEGTRLHQSLYLKDIIERCGLGKVLPTTSPMMAGTKLQKRTEDEGKCPPDYNYRALVGSVMYAMTATRPDICYTVSQVSKFLEDPSMSHHAAITRLYGYLSKTKDLGIEYKSGGQVDDMELGVYVDAEFSTDPTSSSSISGYIITLAGGAISWYSKRQNTTVLSSTEAEYVALTEVTREVLFLKRMMEGLGFKVKSPVTIFEDNTSTIKIAENPVCHAKTKHIHPKYHFIREWVSKGDIKLQHLKSEHMPADMMTKALSGPMIRKFATAIGMKDSIAPMV